MHILSIKVGKSTNFISQTLKNRELYWLGFDKSQMSLIGHENIVNFIEQVRKICKFYQSDSNKTANFINHAKRIPSFIDQLCKTLLTMWQEVCILKDDYNKLDWHVFLKQYAFIAFWYITDWITVWCSKQSFQQIFNLVILIRKQVLKKLKSLNRYCNKHNFRNA